MVFHYLSKRRAAMGLESPLLGAALGRALACPLPGRPGSAAGMSSAGDGAGSGAGISSAGSCPGSGMKKYQKSSCSTCSLCSKNS